MPRREHFGVVRVRHDDFYSSDAVVNTRFFVSLELLSCSEIQQRDRRLVEPLPLELLIVSACKVPRPPDQIIKLTIQLVSVEM